jgi:hypothetical protein
MQRVVALSSEKLKRRVPRRLQGRKRFCHVSP